MEWTKNSTRQKLNSPTSSLAVKPLFVTCYNVLYRPFETLRKQLMPAVPREERISIYVGYSILSDFEYIIIDARFHLISTCEKGNFRMP